MLTRLQKKYAGMPVKFLLMPCNQFGAQEPGSNAEIKAFASKSVKLGGDSNVIMLAKGNLNGVACTYDGADACTPASKECCPKNDGVYKYLLANTKPGNIIWNFDKIITGVDGKPYEGETIHHGADTDPWINGVVEKLLASSTSLLAIDVVGPAYFCLLAGLMALAGLVAVVAFTGKDNPESPAATGDHYLLIA
eukprot:TRINITY_DN6099_c0_g1_i1.p1 TRINITY_DN6099_c0_g1~~TRINITY_DN6099_c0_g1_i1.p1  ORF type:complete len:194 (+),score=53.10 TRINITY_DN6099_c0_g1_i1:231-812(+)